MPVGIEKVVIVEGVSKTSAPRNFEIKANETVEVKAIYHDGTPKGMQGHAQWIIRPKEGIPYTKSDQEGKIGDTRGITVKPKFCGPKQHIIEAFLDTPINRYPTQLTFRAIAPQKIVSTKWSKTNGGSDIRESAIKYGDDVWLNIQTEGLNGATLVLDIYNRQTGSDKKVTSIGGVQCIHGEVNLQIKNTYTWRAGTGIWTSSKEEFYVKLKVQGTTKTLVDDKKQDIHARYLKIEDEIVTRQVEKAQNARPAIVGESEINVERYELCRFRKIVVADDKKDIPLFEEGKLQLDTKQKSEFQVSEVIHFDLDKSEIRNDAKSVLDGIVRLLLDNPYVPAELGAHCDVRASDEYNDKLSQRRAASAREYLVSKGVSRKVITARGYGKRRLLINGNDISEEEHQQNRRLTIRFKIFGGNAESIVFETIAPDESKKKKIAFTIDTYNTDKCLRRGTNLAHDTKDVKVIELTSQGQKGPFVYDGTSKIEHQVYSNLSISVLKIDALKYIWPHKSSTNNFNFHIHSCRYYTNKEKAAVIVKTYPDIKWDFHFFLKLSNPLAVKWQGLDAPGVQRMRKVNGKIAAESKWKQSEAAFGVVLKASWNKIDDLNYEQDFEVTGKYEDKFKWIYNVFSSLKEISKGITKTTKGKATKTLGNKTPFSVEMVPPNFCIGAEWQLARGEIDKKPIKEIGTEYKFYLKSEPLIGVKLIIDLLGGAITAASYATTGNPVAGDIILAIREWAEKGYESERVQVNFRVWFDLIITGTINGGVDFESNTASDKKSASANLESKLGVELTAGIELSAKVVIVKVGSAHAKGHASAGVKLGITSGHHLKYGTHQGLYYKPSLKIDPCIAQVVVYIEVGLSYKVISADWKPININEKRKFWDEFDIIKNLEDISGRKAEIQLIKP